LKFRLTYNSLRVGCKRKRGVEDDIQEVQQACWKQLQEVDIKEELKYMLREEAKFQGLQKLALEAIIRNKSLILVIISIRANKSLLF